MSKFGNVFSSNTLGLEVNINAHKEGASPLYVELIETTGASISSDLNVDERDVYTDAWTRRTATGGKKFDIKFSSVLSQGDAGHDYLRNIAYSEDINDHNNNTFRFIFPGKYEETSTSYKMRVETYSGVLKFENVGPGESLDLAKLEYTLMVSGRPTVEYLENSEYTEPAYLVADGAQGKKSITMTIPANAAYKVIDMAGQEVQSTIAVIADATLKSYTFSVIPTGKNLLGGYSTRDIVVKW